MFDKIEVLSFSHYLPPLRKRTNGLSVKQMLHHLAKNNKVGSYNPMIFPMSIYSRLDESRSHENFKNPMIIVAIKLLYNVNYLFENESHVCCVRMHLYHMQFVYTQHANDILWAILTLSWNIVVITNLITDFTLLVI